MKSRCGLEEIKIDETKSITVYGTSSAAGSRAAHYFQKIVGARVAGTVDWLNRISNENQQTNLTGYARTTFRLINLPPTLELAVLHELIRTRGVFLCPRAAVRSGRG